MNMNYINYIKSISQIELAKIAGVSPSMAYRYKNGLNLPRLDKAFLIEDTFGIPARTWIDLKKIKDTSK